MLAAVISILGFVGMIALIFYYLYKAGVQAERRSNEIATLKDKERIEDAARTVWKDVDTQCLVRRRDVARWMSDYLMQDRKIPPPK